MSLDTVHVEAIKALVERVDRPGRSRDRAELAERIWADVLVDPTEDVPIRPLDSPDRSSALVHDLAVEARPFDRVTAVDAGSLNPTTYQNGLVVDLAHAATGTTPSDVDRHRHRTMHAVVHGPPMEVRSSDDWATFDDGYGRARLVAAPTLDREEETAVHSLALEGAEVDHALETVRADDELVLLDGSVYPASLLHWEDREGGLRTSFYEDPPPRRILEGAVSLVDRCRDDDTALLGFVKNWTARGLIRALEAFETTDLAHLPWRTDYGLFQQLLAIVDAVDEPALRWTSWFHMDYGVGAAMPRAIDSLGLAADESTERYGLAFMVIYDPRENVAFRVEAPLSIVDDTERRDAITRHVLGGVAQTGGPPPTLAKADSLAGIDRLERRTLRRDLGRLLDSTEIKRYDRVRWPDLEAGGFQS